jgi:deazaflavin-dependent oxidoreductase (nitroreductase family)
MAKTFRMTRARRLEGRMTAFFIRLGLVPSSMFVLSVRGRKTGRMRSNPVDHVIEGDQRWLVAPYGQVQWVRNARVAGEVVLSRGGRSETLRISEVEPREAAPVLRQYITRGRFSRPYFDVAPDSPVEAFIAEAPRHPVFRVGSPVESASPSQTSKP